MTDPLGRLAYDREYRHDLLEAMQELHDETFTYAMSIADLYEAQGVSTPLTRGPDGQFMPGPTADLREMRNVITDLIRINEVIAELERP